MDSPIFGPNGSTFPVWEEGWSVDEIWKEEARRVCWTALAIASAHLTRSMGFGEKRQELFVAHPENVRLGLILICSYLHLLTH